MVQTQTQIKISLRRDVVINWTPMLLAKIPPVNEPEWTVIRRSNVKVYVAPRYHVIALDKTPYMTRTGLRIYHPHKVYRYWAEFRVVAPENLQELVGKPVVVKIERMTTVRFGKEVLQVTILPPRNEPKDIRYQLVITATFGKSTGMGGYESADLVNADKMKFVQTFINSSSSGNHWIKWWIIVAPIHINPLFSVIRVSNRGNRYEELYDPVTGKTIPVYQELETIKAWGWGKIVKMRNNLNGEVFTALILEYHMARKTSASTEHIIEPEDAVEFVDSSNHDSKTHWVEIYKVLRPCRVRTIRVSNRGNVYEEVIDVQP